jgi:hypothetical protein
MVVHKQAADTPPSVGELISAGFFSWFELLSSFGAKGNKAPPFIFTVFLGMWVGYWGTHFNFFDTGKWVLPGGMEGADLMSYFSRGTLQEDMNNGEGE